MAITREIEGGLLSGPEWLREQVPVEEVAQWVQVVGQSGSVDKPGLYLLGDVMVVLGYEQSAAWCWGWFRWNAQAGSFAPMFNWGKSVAADLQRALRAWDAVGYWVERRPEEEMVAWLEWIVQRKQRLSEMRVQFCQGCASWCEQWEYPLPQWLQVALGFLPAEAEDVQDDPGCSYQE